MINLRCVFLALALLGGAAVAQAPPGVEDYFPLDVGREWTYRYHITLAKQTRTIEYTLRVARTEELGGAPCAVLESRSGDRVFQVNWYRVEEDGPRLVELQQQDGRTRAVSAYVRPGEDGVQPGRVLLDPEVLAAAPEAHARAWSSPDGASKGTIKLQRRERLRLRDLGELDCIVLVEEGARTAGGRTTTYTRRVWLAPGVGCVQEQVRVVGVDSVTESEATLIRHGRP